MATVRSVTVRLNADVAGYIRDMKAAGAATDAAFDKASRGMASSNATMATSQRQLQGVDTSAAGASRSVTSMSRSTTDLDRSVTSLGRSLGSTDRGLSTVRIRSGQTADSINQLTGRVRLFADAAALLGPGLVPIAAVGVPAIAGLTSQLTAAALAAGAVGVAFVGVPDAIGAVAKYDLEPTAANLQAAQLALSQLGPDAQNFVGAFQEFRPVLSDIRDSAAAGVFPGLTESLGNIEDLAPTVSRLLEDVGRSAGEAIAGGTESLASGRWRDFFDYLRDDAPQTITTLSATLGDFSHGLSELIETLDPGSDAFEGWIARVADGFDAWSTSDQGRKDVEAFLEYAATNGPKVADFFSSLTSALAGLVTAAAPLGGAVLTGLTAVLDVFTGIANSDLGTPLLVAAAGAAVLNRTLGATAGLMARVTGAQAASGAAAGGLFAGTRAQTTQIAAGFDTLRDRAKASQGAVRNLGNALAFSAYSGDTLAKSARSTSKSVADSATRAIQARAAVAGYSGAAAKAGLAVGALAVVSTEAGQGLGLTNTAMLGLAGSMAGPWGAAIGTAAGLLLDFSKMGDAADVSMSTLDAEVGAAGLNFGQLSSTMEVGETRARGYADSLSVMEKAYAGWDRILTGSNSVDTVNQDFLEQQAAAERLEDSYTSLAMGMGDVQGSVEDFTLDELTASAARAQPALNDLGYTAKELEGMSLAGMVQVGMEVRQWGIHADSAAGRTEAFVDSLADLSNDALSTAESASAMSTALSNMLVPAMNAESTTDAWTLSLRGLGEALNQGAGFTDKSTGAIENRAASQEYLAVSMERLTGMAGLATTTQGQMARAVADTRSEFIRSAVAAGMDRDAVIARANAMGLTPKLVRTVFKAAGIDEADLQIREARSNLEALPKEVQTRIRNKGIPETMGEINRLDEKLDLTEKQRQALITLKDLASAGIRIVDGKLRVLDGKKVIPTAGLNDAPFNAVERAIQAGLRALDGTTATPRANLLDQASPQARAITAAINAIPAFKSSTVTVTTIRQTINRVSNVVTGTISGLFGATGMMVQGGVQTFAGGGMRDPSDRPDNHLPEFAAAGPTRVWREPETRGESYIPWADDHRRPRAKAITEATAELFGGRVEWYAMGDGPRGGNARGMERGRDRNDLGRAARDAGNGLRSLSGRLKEAKNAVEAERKQRERLVQSQKQLVTTGRDLFRTELFGTSDSAWGSQDPFGQLQQDIAGGREYKLLMARLKKMGLDGDALAEGAGTLESARYLAGLGKRRVREFEDLYERRDRVSAQAGRAAGNAAYGAEVREQTRELRQANQRLTKIERAVKTADKKNQDGHKESGKRTAKALDGGANKARRRASGPGGRTL